jgi:hypothetical protein
MQNNNTKIILLLLFGVFFSNTTYAQTSGTGAVCVSQSEFTNAVLTCTAATLGATGAAFAVLNGTSCSACFTIPNPVTCGICGALTVFGGTAVYLATQTCQPPEMEVCENNTPPNSPPNSPPPGGGNSGGGGSGGGGGATWDPILGGGGSGGGSGGGGNGTCHGVWVNVCNGGHCTATCQPL